MRVESWDIPSLTDQENEEESAKRLTGAAKEARGQARRPGGK